MHIQQKSSYIHVPVFWQSSVKLVHGKWGTLVGIGLLRDPKGHTSIRILQTILFGIPLILRPGTGMSFPHVSVVFWASVFWATLEKDDIRSCHRRRGAVVAQCWGTRADFRVEVCLCVYICIHIYVCTYIYIYICIHTYKQMHIYVDTYLSLCVIWLDLI